MDCRWRISQLGSTLSSMKLWEWLRGEEEKKRRQREKKQGRLFDQVLMKHGYSLWTVAVFSKLDSSLSGSLPACLPESLRYFQSLSSTTNQLYGDRRSITDHLTPNVQSSSPKRFTKWSFHQGEKEPEAARQQTIFFTVTVGGLTDEIFID